MCPDILIDFLAKVFQDFVELKISPVSCNTIFYNKLKRSNINKFRRRRSIISNILATKEIINLITNNGL